MSAKEKNKAVFIVGPTGVGKTAVGFALAEKIKGEIISADSRQMYREMSIGTDKPPEEYLSSIKHYFIDTIDPGSDFNSGKFGNEAREIIGDIITRGLIPIIVGGSGLYIKAILEGLFEEIVKDSEVRKNLKIRIEEEGTKKLYNELLDVDSKFAERISENDGQRIVRGLEVFYTTGKPLSEHWKKNKIQLNFTPVLIGLIRPREVLYENINKRVDKMIKSGLIEEVEKLRGAGYSLENNSMQTYGYQEVFQHLEGQIGYDDMIELIKKRTRNFAKRQLTWFKKMDGIVWLDATKGKEEIVDTIMVKYCPD
ncbi:MAG: tRNA (adenosine(37)-N6)-dimethylallyltransferase MiaA [bacterium]|nr:tRNA (adenosine(37)-N6)-dimethylallyltransferase MiaA [bacterium]